MTNEKQSLWINQNLFSLKDKSTGATLTINLDSGSSEDEKWGLSYVPMRVVIQIRDKRAVESNRARFDLDYQTLNEFINSIRGLFEGGVKQAVSRGGQISIQRIYSKCKKDLICKVLQRDGLYFVGLKIIDSVNATSESSITINYETFSNIGKLLVSVRDNFTVLSTNNIIALNQERTIAAIEDLNNRIFTKMDYSDHLSDISRKLGSLLGNLSSDKNAVLEECEEVIAEGIEKKIDNPETEAVIDFSDDKSQDQSDMVEDRFKPDSIDIGSDIQSSFEQEFQKTDGFKDLELEGGDRIPNFNNPPIQSSEQVGKQDMTPSPFIGTFLNNNVSRLVQWVTAYINGDFSPYDELLTLSNIPIEERQKIQSSKNYYTIQDIYKKLIIKDLRETLEKESGDLTTDAPVLGFDLQVDSNSTPKLYRLIEEFIVVQVIYSCIRKGLLDYMDADVHGVEEFNRTFLIFSRLSIPFIMSLHFEGLNKFKQDIYSIFVTSKNNGSIDGIKMGCTKITQGGVFDISNEMFNDMLEKLIQFYAQLRKRLITDFSEVYEKFGIEDDFSAELDEVENIEDSRLKLFIKCIDMRKLESKVLDGFRKVSDYDQIVDFIRKNSVPDEFIITKRIVDLHPDIEEVNEIKKMIREWKENIGITLSRVLNEDPPIEDSILSEIPNDIFDGI